MGVNCVRADGPRKPKTAFVEENKIENDEQTAKKENKAEANINQQPVILQNSQTTPAPIPTTTITPDPENKQNSQGGSTSDKQEATTTNNENLQQTQDDDTEIKDCKGRREIVETQEENILDKEKEEKSKKLEEIEKDFQAKMAMLEEIKKKSEAEKKVLEDIEKNRLDEIEKKKQEEIEKLRLEEIERNKIPLYERNCTKIENMLLLSQINIKDLEESIYAISYSEDGFRKSHIDALFLKLLKDRSQYTVDIRNKIIDLFDDIFSNEEIDPTSLILTSSLPFCTGSTYEKKEVLFRNLDSLKRNYVQVQSLNDTILTMLSICVNKIVEMTIGNTTVNDDNLNKLNKQPELIMQYSERYYPDQKKTQLHRHEFDAWFATLNPDELFSSSYHRAAFLKFVKEKDAPKEDITFDANRQLYTKAPSSVVNATFDEFGSVSIKNAVKTDSVIIAPNIQSNYEN